MSTLNTQAANSTTRERTGDLSSWERILGLIEHNLPERHTENLENLSPTDLPALIEAGRQRAEEEHLNGRERANYFAREA